LNFCKNRVFDPKSDFCENFIANIFAMSTAVPPWGGGFESRFLAKSESCGIFCCIPQKSCFSATPQIEGVKVSFFIKQSLQLKAAKKDGRTYFTFIEGKLVKDEQLRSNQQHWPSPHLHTHMITMYYDLYIPFSGYKIYHFKT
jgi:hypothetical protein